ncbi:MAG: SCP2 sterol-binding domain-containing protein [bacterium]
MAMQIRLIDEDKTNLIGFFLRDLLHGNLQQVAHEKAARKLDGRFIFNASGMAVTVIFGEGCVQIEPGAAKKSTAQIIGEMSDLLDVALGANYVPYLLKGKVSIRGNIFKLLKLMKILRK